MGAWIVHQRSGERMGPFADYVEAATYRRDVLRRRLAPTAHCPFAIRVDQDVVELDEPAPAIETVAAGEVAGQLEMFPELAETLF